MDSVVVVVIEGLGTGLIGAYGSSIAATPAMDRMAARGILLDQCFLDSQNLQLQLRSLWTGQHAILAAEHFGGNMGWWHKLTQTENYRARLLTDCQSVAETAAEFGCESVTLIAPPVVESAADDSSKCALMELFATAAEELADGPPGLVWIHSRGLRLPWDAPLYMRRAFTDPDDPDPPSEARLPDMEVNSSTDPDLVVGWGQVAAAQVSVIDEAIGALVATVHARPDAQKWSWILSSLGGVPLGEHGRLGFGHPQLHGEELQVAAIICPANSPPIGLRRPELFQLPDLAATLLALLEIEPRSIWGHDALKLGAPDGPSRWPAEFSLAMISTSQAAWIRSPAWSALFQFSATEEESVQLFVKPEDRWEVSEIANRRQDIADMHRHLANQFVQAVKAGARNRLPALEEDLWNLLR